MTHLLATGATVEGITKMIAEFWCTTVDRISLISTSKNEYSIFQGEKLMDKVIVRKSKGRFRFEMK